MGHGGCGVLFGFWGVCKKRWKHATEIKLNCRIAADEFLRKFCTVASKPSFSVMHWIQRLLGGSEGFTRPLSNVTRIVWQLETLTQFFNLPLPALTPMKSLRKF
jgi:hypothetical protein